LVVHSRSECTSAPVTVWENPLGKFGYGGATGGSYETPLFMGTSPLVSSRFAMEQSFVLTSSRGGSAFWGTYEGGGTHPPWSVDRGGPPGEHLYSAPPDSGYKGEPVER
jgi:hypothetical protein